MPHRHVVSVLDGHAANRCSRRLWTSAQGAWSGFAFERHAITTGYERTVPWHDTHVVLVASGSVGIEDHALGPPRRFVAGPGSIIIWPAGHESRSLSWAGPCEVVDVVIPTATLARVALEDADRPCAALRPRVGIYDPPLATLVRAMEADALADCPAGRLYGESLSLTLAAYLTGRYAAASDVPSTLPDGLSRRTLLRVVDYVRVHLGDDVSVVALARIAGLSPQQFSRRFRRSVGLTPHQYVLHERLREAKRLLAARRRSLAEVAFSLGFSSQSHFAALFRREVGMTPRRYRDGR